MTLYTTEHGPVLEERGEYYQLPDADWDVLVNRGDHDIVLTSMTRRAVSMPGFSPTTDALAPIGRQEVWAAGVTYFRSRTARMEESKSAGGGEFYDRVYGADRAGVFFKTPPHPAAVPSCAANPRRTASQARVRTCASAAIRGGTCPSLSWRWLSIHWAG